MVAQNHASGRTCSEANTQAGDPQGVILAPSRCDQGRCWREATGKTVRPQMHLMDEDVQWATHPRT